MYLNHGSRKRERKARRVALIAAAQPAYPHHPGYWTSTATATPGTSHPSRRMESSVAYLQAPARKDLRDPGNLQRRQPPPGNRWDLPVPKFATAAAVESQGKPESPSTPRKAPATPTPAHRSLEELLNSPVWKLLPEISPLKPTPPRSAPVASPLRTPGSLRQRAVPRSLKKEFEELFGDCSDLDD